MVDVFLQGRVGADPDNADLTLKFGIPDLAEAWSIVRLAARTRIATTPERAEARRQAVRTVTLAGLTVLSVQAADTVLARILLDNFPQYVGFTPSRAAAPGWLILQDWLPTLWIFATVVVLAGRPRAGQLVAAATIATSLITSAVFTLPMANSWLLLILEVGIIAGLAAFTPQAPPPSRCLWVITVAMGTIAVCALNIIAWFAPSTGYSIIWIFADTLGTGAGFWCLAAISAACALLTLRLRGIATPTGVILGVSAFSAAATLVRSESFIMWRHVPVTAASNAAITPAAVQLIIVATIALVTAAIGTTRYLRLPSPSRDFFRYSRGRHGDRPWI